MNGMVSPRLIVRRLSGAEGSRRFLAALCLALVCLVPADTARPKRSTSKPTSKRAAVSQLKSIAVKKKVVRQKARAARLRKATYTEQLADTRRQLSTTRRRIDTATGRLHATERNLAQARSNLKIVRSRLASRHALLKRRLVAYQRHGMVSFASVIFRSTSYWDFLSRTHLVNRLVHYDTRLVQSIKEDEREHVLWTTRLSERSREQRELLAYLHKERQRRNELSAQQASEVIAAGHEQRLYEAQLEELDRNSNEITNFLRRLEASPSGRKRISRPFSGGLGLPTRGYITSRFGMRFHPILHRYKLHTGVDIAAPTGTPVFAAAAGEVVHAGYWGAYGNAVIIDHGGGVTTLYGHLSRINCRVGATVNKGQHVGAVGNTGWSTGSHLHFEKRRNGQPVSPM
jgi:murein DD-endopeptidase MepM/ murein hydrolase activator NlpD